MENKNDKYNGFATAADYIQDIQARYAVFEAENAAFMEPLEEQAEKDIWAHL